MLLIVCFILPYKMCVIWLVKWSEALCVQCLLFQMGIRIRSFCCPVVFCHHTQWTRRHQEVCVPLSIQDNSLTNYQPKVTSLSFLVSCAVLGFTSSWSCNILYIFGQARLVNDSIMLTSGHFLDPFIHCIACALRFDYGVISFSVRDE